MRSSDGRRRGHEEGVESILQLWSCSSVVSTGNNESNNGSGDGDGDGDGQRRGSRWMWMWSGWELAANQDCNCGGDEFMYGSVLVRIVNGRGSGQYTLTNQTYPQYLSCDQSHWGESEAGRAGWRKCSVLRIASGKDPERLVTVHDQCEPCPPF